MKDRWMNFKSPNILKNPWLIGRTYELSGLITLLLLLVTVSLRGGHETRDQIDSLIHVSRKIVKPEDRIKYLLDHVELKSVSHPMRAIRLIREADQVIFGITDAQLKGEMYYWRAWLQYNFPTSEFRNLALSDLRISGELLTSKGEPIWLANWALLAAYATIYVHSENLDQVSAMATQSMEEARFHLENSRKYAALISNSRQDSLRILAKYEQSYASLALVSEGAGIDSAILALERSKDHFEHADDSLGLAGVLSELVRVLPPDQIEVPYRTAEGIYQSFGSQWGLARLNEKRGLNYQERFVETDSLYWFDQSVKYLQEALQQDTMIQAKLYLSLAYNYHLKATLHTQDQLMLFDFAAKAYLEALHSGKRESELEVMRLASNELSNICSYLGNCTALIREVSENYQEVIDTSKQIAAKAIEREGSFRLQLSEQKSKSQKTAILLIGGLFISLIAGAGLFVIQKKQNRLQKERIHHLQVTMESRLETLRAQLNPHFISNNLNVLESHVIHSRTEQASEHIVQFARLCRIILENSRKKLISWKKELDLQRHYLSLIRSGAAGELDFNLVIEKGIETSVLGIPPMLLNPFVENAVKHGYEKKRGHTTIQIRLHNTEDGRLCCEVLDDGIGRARVKALQERMVIKDRPSYGTDLVREQLDQYEQAELRIEDIELHGEVAGTKVQLLFPRIDLNLTT